MLSPAPATETTETETAENPPPAPPKKPPAKAAPPPADDADDDAPTLHQQDRALSDRVARERRRMLREEFGTDNEEKIAEIRRARTAREEEYAAKQQELERLKQEEEARKRAQMGEVERLNQDLTAAKAENARLQGELDKLNRNLLAEKQTNQITQIAGRHGIDGRHVKLLQVELADHYRSLPKKERERFEGVLIDRWVRDWAKQNPEYCKPVNGIAPPKPVVKKPLGQQQTRTAAAPPAKPGPSKRPPDEDENGKTTRPGLPNSMTRDELKAFRAKQGRNASPY